jgi:LytS/YehU family sensor histidine kinase
MIQVDQDAESILIPVLSIQPLVENAIKHGLASRPDEGWLRVSARIAEGALHVEVEDSGATPSGDAPQPNTSGAGVGLANVSRRLQLCFGGEGDLKMEHSAFGTKVQLTVPVSQLAEEGHHV